VGRGGSPKSPGRLGQSPLPERLRRFYDVGGVYPEFFHHLIAGRAHPEAAQADDFSIETDVLIPDLGNAGFDRNATAAGHWQNFFTIFDRLPVESFEP